MVARLRGCTVKMVPWVVHCMGAWGAATALWHRAYFSALAALADPVEILESGEWRVESFDFFFFFFSVIYIYLFIYLIF